MAPAATHSGHDPDQLSFVAALRISRQSIAQQGAFPPEDPHATQRHWHQFLARRLARLNPARRLAPPPESSSARCPSGTSNAPTTPTGRSHNTHRSTPSTLTERYWG